MSEQINETYFAWLNKRIDKYEPPSREEVWNAATAEANKRIEALEGEVANLRLNIKAQEQLGYELQANNHDLREAISKHIAAYRYVLDVEKDYREYGIGGGTYTSDAASHANSELISSIEALVKLESTTPSESLQAHENEVIEKCAKVCDVNIAKYGYEFVKDIRALKGK